MKAAIFLRLVLDLMALLYQVPDHSVDESLPVWMRIVVERNVVMPVRVFLDDECEVLTFSHCRYHLPE